MTCSLTGGKRRSRPAVDEGDDMDFFKQQCKEDGARDEKFMAMMGHYMFESDEKARQKKSQQSDDSEG